MNDRIPLVTSAIRAVRVLRNSTEDVFEITASFFADCSGVCGAAVSAATVSRDAIGAASTIAASSIVCAGCDGTSIFLSGGVVACSGACCAASDHTGADGAFGVTMGALMPTPMSSCAGSWCGALSSNVAWFSPLPSTDPLSRRSAPPSFTLNGWPSRGPRPRLRRRRLRRPPSPGAPCAN